MEARDEAAVRERLARELSLPPRVAYVLLLLAGLAGAIVTGALAITEPGLPARTRLALAGLALIGCCWTAFAAWVLARRRVLLVQHRVVAARMATAFSALFVLACVALRVTSPAARAWLPALLLGLVMLAVAALLLVRARQRVARLAARRDELLALLHESEQGA